jgi:hypothetical protein
MLYSQPIVDQTRIKTMMSRHKRDAGITAVDLLTWCLFSLERHFSVDCILCYCWASECFGCVVVWLPINVVSMTTIIAIRFRFSIYFLDEVHIPMQFVFWLRSKLRSQPMTLCNSIWLIVDAMPDLCGINGATDTVKGLPSILWDYLVHQPASPLVS